MLLGLSRSLWGYRGFVLGSVKREFQSRYRGSLFGALWTVLNPLSMIVVYTVIFSQVMRAPAGGRRRPGLQRLSLRRPADLGPVRGNHLAQPEHVHRERQPAEEDQLPAHLPAGHRTAQRRGQFRHHPRLVPRLSRTQRAPAGRGIARAGAAAGDPGAVRGGTGDDPRGAQRVLPRRRPVVRQLCALGLRLFRQRVGEMVDEL